MFKTNKRNSYFSGYDKFDNETKNIYWENIRRI
jgi:hypothetical protein